VASAVLPRALTCMDVDALLRSVCQRVPYRAPAAGAARVAVSTQADGEGDGRQVREGALDAELRVADAFVHCPHGHTAAHVIPEDDEVRRPTGKAHGYDREALDRQQPPQRAGAIDLDAVGLGEACRRIGPPKPVQQDREGVESDARVAQLDGHEVAFGGVDAARGRHRTFDGGAPH
jgi:hypothetical protein